MIKPQANPHSEFKSLSTLLITIDVTINKESTKNVIPTIILNGVRNLRILDINFQEKAFLLSLYCNDDSILEDFALSSFSYFLNLLSNYLSFLDTYLCDR